MFLSILTTFHLILAFVFNYRWVNFSHIFVSLHFNHHSQFSLFYHLTMFSIPSILSVIYHTGNFTVFKYIAVQLFACICFDLVLFGLIICIFYHFERKLSAILDFCLFCQPYWISCHSQHFWNARPHLGEPILLSLRSICQFRGHF